MSENDSTQGLQKDNNVKACLKVLNKCGKDFSRFVSFYLDELPPVTFSSIDVSALLGRIEQLNKEVSGMKKMMESQVGVCEVYEW